MNQSNNSSSRPNTILVIILALIVIALLVLAFFFFTNRGPDLVGDPLEEEDMVVVEEVDFQVAETDQDRLPAGFPFGLPINYETMTLSESADYSHYAEDLVHNNVAFTADSEATFESVVTSFQEYFNENSYEVQVEEQGNLTIIDAHQAEVGSFLVLITELPDQIAVTIQFTSA